MIFFFGTKLYPLDLRLFYIFKHQIPLFYSIYNIQHTNFNKTLVFLCAIIYLCNKEDIGCRYNNLVKTVQVVICQLFNNADIVTRAVWKYQTYSIFYF